VVRRALWLFLLALLLVGCGESATRSIPPPQPSFARAEDEGLDPDLLRAADRRFAATSALVSVLAMRHGVVVFERYYHGASATVDRNVFSVTKSVVSGLVGIALARGQLQSLDQTLADFFPEKLQGEADPRIRAITLRDLLTMTAGYRETSIYSTDDWVRTLLNRPLASDPGTTFAYDDGSAHLVSAILTKATGVSAATLAQTELFTPLGIHAGRWSSDGQGRSLGSTGLFLRSRDLLKLGRLYLQHGRWSGRQIVPASWVRESTTMRAEIRGGYAYGYFWWVNTGPHGGFAAQGYAGQLVAVYPRLDLVIVMTGAGSFDQVGALRLLLRAVVR
jgi:CubicO group peptidase (beta-lactamase class C family)